MDVILSFVVVYFCCLLLCFYLKLEWTHPAVIHAALWFLASCLAGYYSDVAYLPKNYYLLTANLMFFCFAVVGSETRVRRVINSEIHFKSNIYLNCLPFLFILIFYILLFAKFSIGFLSDTPAFRDYLVSGDGGNYGLFGRLALISLFSSGFLLLRNKKLFLISAILCLPIVFILGAKTLVLLYLITLLILTPKRLSFIKIISFGILFVLSFFLVMSVRYPDASINQLLYYLYNYTSGGMLAFSQIIEGKNSVWGMYTFRNIYLWVNIFYPINVAAMLQEWLTVPFPVNVYTYLRPYYVDFGYYSIIFPAIFGYFSGRVYVSKYKNIRSYYVLYPIVMYAIVMQLFDDQYLTWLSNWLVLAIIGSVMTWGWNNGKNSSVNSNIQS